MIQIGDKVEVIDELIKGVVKNIVQNQISIKTDDGLEFLFDKEEKKTKKNYSTPKKDKNIKIMEIDLHIEQLVDNPRGMQNYEILTKQLNVARYQLELAIENRFQKVIFIHGVGEGVLKLELEYLLGRYTNISYYDADYAKYGQGATEVYIHQSKR